MAARPDLLYSKVLAPYFTLKTVKVYLEPSNPDKSIDWQLIVANDNAKPLGHVGIATVTAVPNVLLKLIATHRDKVQGTKVDSRYLTIVNGCDISTDEIGLRFNLGFIDPVDFSARVICR